MIALASAAPRQGYRYILSGQISKNAQWSQVLELPADGNTVDISGQDVRISFRLTCNDPEVSVFSPAEITVTDDDTLTIDVAPSVIANLCDNKSYIVDLTSVDGDVITHWAHGSVFVTGSPPGY